MKKLYMVLPLILLFCFTFGCQQGEEAGVEADVGIEVDAGIEADVEAERAAITESLQALIDAAVKGDTEKLKSFGIHKSVGGIIPRNIPMAVMFI